jgi:hypothetical protein
MLDGLRRSLANTANPKSDPGSRWTDRDDESAAALESGTDGGAHWEEGGGDGGEPGGLRGSLGAKSLTGGMRCVGLLVVRVTGTASFGTHTP